MQETIRCQPVCCMMPQLAERRPVVPEHVQPLSLLCACQHTLQCSASYSPSGMNVG